MPERPPPLGGTMGGGADGEAAGIVPALYLRLRDELREAARQVGGGALKAVEDL